MFSFERSFGNCVPSEAGTAISMRGEPSSEGLAFENFTVPRASRSVCASFAGLSFPLRDAAGPDLGLLALGVALRRRCLGPGVDEGTAGESKFSASGLGVDTITGFVSGQDVLDFTTSGATEEFLLSAARIKHIPLQIRTPTFATFRMASARSGSAFQLTPLFPRRRSSAGSFCTDPLHELGFGLGEAFGLSDGLQVARGLLFVAALADGREAIGVVRVVTLFADSQRRTVVENEGSGDGAGRRNQRTGPPALRRRLRRLSSSFVELLRCATPFLRGALFSQERPRSKLTPFSARSSWLLRGTNVAHCRAANLQFARSTRPELPWEGLGRAQPVQRQDLPEILPGPHSGARPQTVYAPRAFPTSRRTRRVRKPCAVSFRMDLQGTGRWWPQILAGSC